MKKNRITNKINNKENLNNEVKSLNVNEESFLSSEYENNYTIILKNFKDNYYPIFPIILMIL